MCIFLTNVHFRKILHLFLLCFSVQFDFPYFPYSNQLFQTSQCSTHFSFSEKEPAYSLSLGFPQSCSQSHVHTVHLKIIER